MQHLQSLVGAGNTVVVVEHDMRAVKQVDWIIDLGPGTGGRGPGKMVAVSLPAASLASLRKRKAVSPLPILKRHCR